MRRQARLLSYPEIFRREFMAFLGPAQHELSGAEIVMMVLNAVMTLLVVFVQWSLRRLVKGNDDSHKSIRKTEAEAREKLESSNADDHKKMEEAIDRLTSAISAEREARHEFHDKLDTRVWTVNEDLKENYPKRVELMRLFGSLSQKQDRQHREEMDAIAALPCRAPSCPISERGAS
jgi:uncharacterized membrane protein